MSEDTKKEDTKKIEEQLEKATASGDTLDAALDAETTSLREGWLALGQLIEAAQPPSARSAQLQYPTQAAPLQRRKLLGRKTLTTLAVLAASLVVAAIVTRSFVEDQADAVKDRPQITQVERSTTDTDGILAWDSSLDTEIAAAGQEMLRIQADSYASDDTSSALYYRIQQMQQDLSNNTL